MTAAAALFTTIRPSPNQGETEAPSAQEQGTSPKTETLIGSGHGISPVLFPLYVAEVGPDHRQGEASGLSSPGSGTLPYYEPAGCSEPLEDYSPVQAGERVLSARTLGMLTQAARLYSGPIDITDTAIVSIGHEDKQHQSPDPHRDGGVIDISLYASGSRTVQYGEVNDLVGALRAVGFAAWLRDVDDLYPGSEAHIHAVAIGDGDLSRQARSQLTGKYGYFRGRKGYLDSAGAIDPHGGPVLCRWMVEAGHTDMSVAAETLRSSPWEERLLTAAESFITTTPEETLQVARALGFQRSGQEDPSNMCGPLSAAILREAGLLPSLAGPATNLDSYWLADPLTNGRPWSLFPEGEYEVHRFARSIESFDFSEWPLFPGDFVFSYSGTGSFSHMFVVTETDATGRTYTVTNQEQPDGNFLIQRLLLYDPADPGAGVFRARCQDCGTWRRRTGLGGFDVLRHTTLISRLTSEVTHRVRPGDTLPEIAAKYGTSVTGIISFNEFSDTTILNVGAELAIPSSLGWDVISQVANAPESKSSLDRPDIAAGNLVQTFNQTTSSTN